MKKDIEWLKGEVKNFQEAENMFTGEFDAGVQQALEYVQELIDQLDEPEKPVIPQFVVEQLEYWERNKMNILWQFWLKEIPSSIMWWLEEDVANYDKMLEVVKYGYEVEEEQKYQVIIRDGEYIRLFLCKHGDNVMIGTNGNYIEKCPEVTYLTEKEIKDYDERYWAFAEEVVE